LFLKNFDLNNLFSFLQRLKRERGDADYFHGFFTTAFPAITNKKNNLI